jgi:hypothetical protein
MKCKFEHDGHCCNCGATQYMIECKQPCETIVTMTNADRIRSMSDEELAEYVGKICLCSHIQDVDRKFCDCRAVCTNCIVEWLKQPVEVDNG